MTDYSAFTTTDFDPNEYAHSVLAGGSHSPQQHGKATATLESAKEDISVAISKLTLGIDDVSKQIKNTVTTHHEELLEHAAGVYHVSGSLISVRQRLDDLDGSAEKLRQKVCVPYHSLHSKVKQLHQLQQASLVLRRVSRFIMLAKRLEAQMGELGVESATETHGSMKPNMTATERLEEHEDEKDRAIAKAAHSISELQLLLDEGISPTFNAAGSEFGVDFVIPLANVTAISRHVSSIGEARQKVTTAMESMVHTGLSTLNQSLLASSLQTAHNLRILPDLVQSLIQDISSLLEDRIRATFDLTQISKDVLAKETPQTQSSHIYRSRIRTEPTNVTAPQWTASLWSKLEGLVDHISLHCIRIYTLEKVLKLKKDTVTQTVFLDEAMKVLENKPSTAFWTALGTSLEKYTKDASKGSMFLQQTLSMGYPKLLRLFHQLFAKIAVHTDTTYTQSHQSPETVLVFRALNTFESLYLSRSLTRMNETIAQTTRNSTSIGLEGGVSVARVVINELDAAKFDPLLIRGVAKGAATSLTGFVNRVDGLISRDRSAVSLTGPSVTPHQAVNAQVATCLYHCFTRLEKIQEEYPEAIYLLLEPNIKSLRRAYQSILEPLATAIRRELGAIIARLHRIDFGKPVESMTGMAGGASLYMRDLVEKLALLKGEVLARFNIGEDARSWVMSIVTFVIRSFVLHVSIARPLGEGGKLQLTSDMTELEFALNAFLTDNSQSKKGANLESVGDDYHALRAMRHLIFLENEKLATPSHTKGLPTLVVLHHILARSSIPLPHSLHGWQELEYVRWVEEHSEEESWSLVESGIVHWEKILEAEHKEPDESDAQHAQLARAVLSSAKGR